MNFMPTLTPAYGRDYKSKKAVLADYNAGKDFIYNCITSQWDGKYCNKADLEGAEVKIRYDKLTKVIVTRGSDKQECKYKACKKMHSPNDDHILFPPNANAGLKPNKGTKLPIMTVGAVLRFKRTGQV